MKRSNKKTRWIVILGYGRSGSTWLELNIAEKADAVCLGEFFLLGFLGSVCSCGFKVADCECWKGFLPFSNEERIRKVSLSNSSVTDSSKSARSAVKHLIALSKADNITVIPIICFRHPVRILRSARKGDNRLMRDGVLQSDNSHWLRFVITWPLSYMTAFIFCMLNYIKPSFVDFDDYESIQSLLSRIKSDAESNADMAHIIEGNRLINTGVTKWRRPKSIGKLSFRERIVILMLYPFYKILCILERKNRG